MKKYSILAVMGIGLIAASCSSDEPMAPLSGAQTQIGFNVTADKGTRGSSAFENGTDVNTINVSAWAIAPKKDNDGNRVLDENGKFTFALPSYDQPNIGNSYLFLNDVLNRSGENGKKGTFSYSQDARYWPSNDEIVDFYAMVDNDKAWGTAGVFDYTKVDGKKPGTDVLTLLDVDKMPDMLFATTFNQTLNKSEKEGQQNVSFHFDHAFAKVAVTAEVRNNNLHVVLTGISFHGIVGKGQFCMPYKSGDGPTTVYNDATWIVGENDYVDLPVAEMTPKGEGQSKDKVVLDIYEGKTKESLIGGQTSKNPFNDVFVIPSKYNGRNGSGKIQTYIELTGYAYNKAGKELDEDTDMLIYGTNGYDEEGNIYPIPMKMIIPIEFNWVMGTLNKYNIVFDCGNGGSQTTDPNNPAFIRIGYEVEVEDWEDVDNGDYEYPDNLKK